MMNLTRMMSQNVLTLKMYRLVQISAQDENVAARGG